MNAISLQQATRPESALAPAAAPELQQIARDVAALALDDAAQAGRVLRDMLAGAPAHAGADLSSAVTSKIADPGLAQLARSFDGRELLDTLRRPLADMRAGNEGQLQAKRLERALHGMSEAVSEAKSAQSSLRSMDLQGFMRQVQLGQQPLHARIDGASASAARGEGGTEDIKSLFKEQFAARAADKEGFHAFMKQVYGDKYDVNVAEQFRQQALAGDFSWLPNVKLVDAGALGGANGAYNEKEGVVYINRDLAAKDPQLAAQTFVEEAGHHLDAKLNTGDTRGDEGEMFRRLLGGEKLSQQQADAIRNENDKGTITVDGKQVEVEFWFGEDLVDAAGDAAKAVGKAAGDVVDAVGSAAGDVVDHVGTAARDIVYSVGDMVKEPVMGLVGAAGFMMSGLAEAFGGTIVSLFQGNFADAADTFLRGLDKAVIQAPRRFINGMLEGAGHLFKTATYILPAKAGGEFLRDVIDRGVDSVRTVANGAIDIARNFFRLPFEIGAGFMRDFGEALRYWGRGDIGEGFERLGLAFVNPFQRVGGAFFDSGMIAAQGIGNIAGNLTGQHSPSRGLNNDEREYLRNVYGDSLNLDDIRIHRHNISHELGMAPHCVGNDIYLPDDCFNSDGTLNEKGRQTLVHEAFHVYQAQHGGNDYIHGALMAQAGEMIDGNSRNAAYDWTQAVRDGKPFNEWNAEQQAEFLETVSRAKQGRWGPDNDGDGRPDNDYDLNNNGRIDLNELELAWEDRPVNGRPSNGVRDTAPAGSPPGTADPEPDLVLTQQQFDWLMAHWESMKDNRPDRRIT